jgi:nucleolar protein 14
LIAEFQTRGKNNVFIDKRIGGNNTTGKLSEEDKMRLRYLREQKEQLRQTKVSHKRAKYNLDDLYSDDDGFGGDEDGHLGGFTHRGRPLEEMDDFQDDIPVTSDDDQNDDRDQQMGKLSEEMVMTMNFGGGRRPPAPTNEPADRTRKEIFEEIIAKSKAYKAAKFEVKEAAKELTDKLDKQFFDILPLLNMSKVKTTDTTSSGLDAYEQIAAKLKEQARAQPTHVIMGEREQARMRKTKLQALAEAA